MNHQQQLMDFTGQGYPPNCLSCGLYQTSSYYRSRMHYVSKGTGKPVLVVTNFSFVAGEWTSPQEQHELFLLDVLNRIDIPWAVTSNLKCEPNYNNKPKQVKNCFDQCRPFLMEDVNYLYNTVGLGCIVCLGEQAFKSFFPDTPLTLAQAAKGVRYIQVGNSEIPVLVIHHPGIHFQPAKEGGRDLRKEYVSTFEFAIRICKGQYSKPAFEYEVLTNSEEIDNWFARCGAFYSASEERVYDVEVSMNSQIEEKRTVCHPQSNILCFNITYTRINPQGKPEPRIVVVRTREMTRRQIYSVVMRFLDHPSTAQRCTLIGSNIAFDLVSTFFHSSDEWFERYTNTLNWLSKLLVANQYDLTPFLADSFLYGFCQDFGSIENGLKEQYSAIFKEPRYDTEIDEFKKIYGRDFGLFPVDRLEHYAAMDGYAQWMVYMHYKEQIFNPENPLLTSYRFFLQQVIASVLLTVSGIPVDVDYFLKAEEELQNIVDAGNNWVNTHPITVALNKTEFNVKSSPQKTAFIEYTLFWDENKNLHNYMERSPSGHWVADDEKLDLLSKHCGTEMFRQFWKTVIEIKDARDLLVRFISMPIDYSIEYDGYSVLHPSYQIAKSAFNQANPSGGFEKNKKTNGTETGRWAANPNSMNFPARDEAKAQLVRAGLPAFNRHPLFGDMYLCNGDLKTIEPVVQAWIANCQRAKDIFMLGCVEPKNPNGDWYLGVGQTFWEKPAAQITKAQRTITKNNILLALTYGQHPRVLCDVLGCDEDKAIYLTKKFFYEDFPELHIAYEECRYRVFYGQPIHTVVETTSFYPLNRAYDYDRSKHYWMLPFELSKELRISPDDDAKIREANNFRIQGAAGWINANGMINIFKRIMTDAAFSRAVVMHNTVHDALVMSITKKNFHHYLNEVATIIYDPEALNAQGFKFGFTREMNPLRGEFTRGAHYGDKEEVEYAIQPRRR